MSSIQRCIRQSLPLLCWSLILQNLFTANALAVDYNARDLMTRNATGVPANRTSLQSPNPQVYQVPGRKTKIDFYFFDELIPERDQALLFWQSFVREGIKECNRHDEREEISDGRWTHTVPPFELTIEGLGPENRRGTVDADFTWQNLRDVLSGLWLFFPPSHRGKVNQYYTCSFDIQGERDGVDIIIGGGQISRTDLIQKVETARRG